jgi:hypothetical protein
MIDRAKRFWTYFVATLASLSVVVGTIYAAIKFVDSRIANRLQLTRLGEFWGHQSKKVSDTSAVLGDCAALESKMLDGLPDCADSVAAGVMRVKR